MDEQSIFQQALERPAGKPRAAWLDEVCGVDSPLRKRIDALLRRHEQANSFLEKPPVEQPETLAPGASDDNVAESLKAGLAAAFPAEAAVVIGSAGHSVLRALGQTIELRRVVLRDPANEGSDPISQPTSPEVPKLSTDTRYQLQGEIARGGMGAILKGRDIDLGRELAIKVLLDAHKDNPDVVRRFVEEAQIGGQLQHPGIAPIYELGQFADKRPFFAMKLVKGETLAKLLADRADHATERGKFIGIFEQICQTMAYAHSRGVIHRDLKPANIMVGAFGEVQVMDWGLAKVLPAGGIADEKKAKQKHLDGGGIQTLRTAASKSPGPFGSAGSETQLGSIMGTPAYMPPEQALGDIDNLDQRTDVFGLGAILTEILTGLPPYVAADGTGVFHLASRGQLKDCLARLDACGAEEALIALAKDCLQVNPADRPENAGVLATRVNRYLESVESKLRETELLRASEAARAEEADKRTRVTLGLACSLVLVLLAGIAGTTWQARQAELARIAEAERAEGEAKERKRAEAGEKLANERLAIVKQQTTRAAAISKRAEAVDLENDGKTDEAIARLRESVEIDPTFYSGHDTLGFLLMKKGRFDEAMACFRKVIKLDPSVPEPHFSLGVLLADKGQWDEAIVCYRKAIELAPSVPEPHMSLGALLADKGRWDEAIVSCRKAIELAPSDAEPHIVLGRVLAEMGQLDEALVCCRKASQLEPENPLGSAGVRQIGEIIDAGKKVPAYLNGAYKPTSGRELQRMKEWCRFKKQHYTGVKLLTAAFAANPKLADDLSTEDRYKAACFAALAAAGQAEDSTQLDDQERTRLRKQAHDWLRADLILLTKQLQSLLPGESTKARTSLARWQKDPALASLRDATALAKLPADEQKSLAQLWAEVVAVQGRD